MPRQLPFLQRRRDTFFFRIAVPADLRSLAGKRELTRTLQTTNRQIAVPMALSLAASAKQLFHQLRTTMTDKRKSADGIGFYLTTSFEFDETGNLKGVEVKGEPGEDSAVIEASKAIVESNAIARQKYQVVAPVAYEIKTSRPQNLPTAPTLDEVVEKFLDGYSHKIASQNKLRTTLNMFLRFMGDKPVTDIKQIDLADFLNLIQRLPSEWYLDKRIKKKTATWVQLANEAAESGAEGLEEGGFLSHQKSMTTFLKWAVPTYVDQGFPQTLSVRNIKYTGAVLKGENKQRSLTSDELKRLFEGGEMKAFAADQDSAHKYWLPTIALFTGARDNEICQINPQTDIRKDESGIWYFWITQITEADKKIRKSVKTGEGRTVPIHKKLIELGILDYVERVTRKGAKRIFPKWGAANGRACGMAEQWFGEFLDDIGLRDDRPRAVVMEERGEELKKGQGTKVLGMHVFRHTLLTHGLGRKIGDDKAPIDLTCITGHASGDLPLPIKGAAAGYIDVSLVNTLTDRKKLLDQLDYGLSFHKPVAMPARQ